MGSFASTAVDTSASLQKRKRFSDIYNLGDELGVGAFAKVCKCYRKTDEAPFAVKLIDKAFLSNKELFSLRDEIHILKKLPKHDNVIDFIDLFDDGYTVYLVLELCQPQNLYELIASSKDVRLSESRAAQITRQLANGLSHLHKHGVTHRDLKLENVLFGLNGEVKLCDFGLASESKDALMLTCCGSPHYVCRDVLLRKGYTNAVDYWSLGVVLYVMLVGCQPFDAETLPDIYNVIIEGSFDLSSCRWNGISSEAKDLVSCLLEKDPDQRYSAKDIRAHSWIQTNITVLSKGASVNKLRVQLGK